MSDRYGRQLANRECKFCGKIFRWTSSLKLHLRIHTNERPYSCTKCDKTFTQKIHLQRHFPVHFQKQNQRSNVSSLETSIIFQKSTPMNTTAAISVDLPETNSPTNSVDGAPTTTSAEDIRCHECNVTFDRWLDLLQHTSEAHPREEDQDGDEINEDGSAIDEISVDDSNNGDSKLRTTWCHICNKHLATVSSRNLHMRIHTGERPFACSECGKSFTQNVHLRSHMSVHTGAKPYLCKICNKGFVAGRTLKIHMMSHTREQPFTCQWCSRKFLIRQHLVTHIATHHGQMLQHSDDDEEQNEEDEETPPTMVSASQITTTMSSLSSVPTATAVAICKPRSFSLRSKRKSLSTINKNRLRQVTSNGNQNLAVLRQRTCAVQNDEDEDNDDLADIITSMENDCDEKDIKRQEITFTPKQEVAARMQSLWEGNGCSRSTSFKNEPMSELFKPALASSAGSANVQSQSSAPFKTSRRKCSSTVRAVRIENSQKRLEQNDTSTVASNRAFHSPSSSVSKNIPSFSVANSLAGNGSEQHSNVFVNSQANSNNFPAVSSQNNACHSQNSNGQSSNNNCHGLHCNNRISRQPNDSVVGSSMQQCPNCLLVEGELQLLKSELSMIKQFLGNKLTLMEQKIDNMTTMIKQ